MCGRFTLRTPASAFARLFTDLELTPPEFKPRYNIAPTQTIAAVRQSPAGGFVWSELRWGLIPFWAKDRSLTAPLINARSETVATKPAFRAAFKSRRCLIPADGFYEWQKLGGTKKQPQYISLQGQRPFCFAGLWESWKDDETQAVIESCTIITTSANERLAAVHDRMPVIVDPADYRPWLEREFQNAGWLAAKLNPWPSDDIAFYPVSNTVNNARHEQPECIRAMA